LRIDEFALQKIALGYLKKNCYKLIFAFLIIRSLIDLGFTRNKACCVSSLRLQACLEGLLPTRFVVGSLPARARPFIRAGQTCVAQHDHLRSKTSGLKPLAAARPGAPEDLDAIIGSIRNKEIALAI